MPARIPVILVTGFLGSGKTTLLQRLATDHPEKRLVFLINELADLNVDQATLGKTGRPIRSVVGGSLFCECKAGEFVRVMREQVLVEDHAEPLDAVVIETSGIADPEAIGELISLHGLGDHFAVSRVVCVVAPNRFLTLFENLPAVRSQLAHSDLVVINKTDLADSDRLDQVEALVRTENPEATIFRGTHCQVPIDLSAEVRAFPRRPLASCEANPFSTRTGVWPEALGLAEARAWLVGLPETILRVKGSLRTPEGTWGVERTVDSLEIVPSEPSSTAALVLIAHDDHEQDLARAIRSLEALAQPALSR